MKKFLFALLAVLVVCSLAFAACGGETPTPENPAPENPAPENPTPENPTPENPTPENPNPGDSAIQITGITLEDATVIYDGTAKSLAINGTLPSGVSVSYTYNGVAATSATDAGAYTVVATLAGEGYKTLTLTKTLTIEKAAITGITLSNDTVDFDENPHSIQVLGNVPAGVVVTYTYNGDAIDAVTNSGTYEVKAVLSGKNYVTLELTATLKINAVDKELFSYVFGGKVYFQNPLHDDLLYCYDGTTLTRVGGNDMVRYFTTDGSNLYFDSKGLIKSSIKVMSVLGTVKTFSGESGEFLTIADNYMYFAVNKLIDTNNENGIYRLPLDSSKDDLPTQITPGKASHLAVYDGYVYYAAGADKGVLTRVSVKGGTPVALTEEKVSDIVLAGDNLYFNVLKTIGGNAIHRYSLTTSGATPEKMTTDSGKNLTVIGGFLYYINNDLLTGNIFGDGIYCVSLNADGSLPGLKIVDAKVCSLSSNGTHLFFYQQSNGHFFRANMDGSGVKDIMDDFEPIDDTVVEGYTYVKEYEGEIYYLNMRDGGAIYKYNPATRMTYKVIPESCSAFYFNGGYLYYSAYFATNYNLYRMPIAGGEAERISTSRCDHLVFVGEYIYYIDNGNTYNTLRRLKPDSVEEDKEDEVLFGSLTGGSVHILSLGATDGKIWFCTKAKLDEKKNMLYYYDIAQDKAVEVTSGELFTQDTAAVYFYNRKDSALCKYTLSSGDVSTLKTGVTITSIALHAGKLYYTDSALGGVWEIGLDGTAQRKIANGTYMGVASTTFGLVFYEVSFTYELDYPISHTGGGYLMLWDGTNVIKISK